MAMAHLTCKQHLKIKSPIVDTNNHLNNYFSFYLVNQKDTDIRIIYCNKLNNIYKDFLIDQNTVLVISNTNIKNNITISVSYIHKKQDTITKTVHYIMNVLSTEAELFIIRCGINHVT